MFLVFTLVLLVVAMGILASVYSIFFPFMQNLGTVSHYHQAYYGAISSIERAELVLRYRMPGFIGSGGFLGTTGYGPLSDLTPELFSGNQQGFGWTIDSRTTSIPRQGMGNTDPMFSDSNGKDYNALGYINLETFLLSYDPTTDYNKYYSGGIDLVFFSGDTITGVLRLPPKILSGFGGSPDGLLCDTFTDSCDPDGDDIYDDIVLSWSLEGLYLGENFIIIPSISIFSFSGVHVNYPFDNAIRETFINGTGKIAFNQFTLLDSASSIQNHVVISEYDDQISSTGFKDIFQSPDFSELYVSFGAINLFRTRNGNIYPYLEYQFTFSQPIADRFYTIQGHGRVGEYDIQIVIKKPTVKGTVGSDFTIRF